MRVPPPRGLTGDQPPVPGGPELEPQGPQLPLHDVPLRVRGGALLLPQERRSGLVTNNFIEGLPGCFLAFQPPPTDSSRDLTHIYSELFYPFFSPKVSKYFRLCREVSSKDCVFKCSILEAAMGMVAKNRVGIK